MCDVEAIRQSRANMANTVGASVSTDALDNQLVKRPCYILIDEGVTSMISVISHANSLLDKINGERPEETIAECKRPEPLLQDVLQTTPSRLMSIEQELHQILDMIEESILS